MDRFTLTVLAASLVMGAQAAPASSTFVLPGINNNQNLTFAINLPKDSDEMFFYMSGPVQNSWLAVGAGSEMPGSLMFVAYPGQDGRKAVLSPRIATGNNEPSYTSDIKVDVQDGSGVSSGILTIKGHCLNCRKWNRGSLNVNSQNQPWIYAIGHDDNLRTDSLTANLRRHQTYGGFNMDMRQATGDGGPPTDISKNSGASQNGNPTTDRDFSRSFHALIMCAMFVILFPVGALFMRVFGSVRWHLIIQLFGLFLILIGAALGIKLSTLYNKSKKYNSAHQIIGLLVVSFCIAQAVLGFVHHTMFKKNQRKTPFGMVHRILGPSLILLGILNGGLGFPFANATRLLLPYIIILVAFALFTAGVLFLRNRWVRKKAVFDNPRTANFEEGLAQQQQQQYPSDVPLSSMPAHYQSGSTTALYPPPPRF